MKVICTSCAWKGEHTSGPIQGASCPNCGGGPIARHEIAEIDLSEPPTFTGGPDYSANHG